MEININNLVIDALRQLADYDECPLWTVDNVDKYSTINKSQSVDGKQQDIFKLMHALNVEGIYQSGTCAGQDGAGSLYEMVNSLGEVLADLVSGKRVHYVELGPEPVKTSELIRHLVDSAADLVYTAIDINQTSESFMRAELLPLLKSPERHFRFLASDYHDISREQLEVGQDITLITMLGFQEGNELPTRIGKLINQLGGQSTLVISEVQLYKQDNQDHIYNFYMNENMVNFSKLVCIQQGLLAYDQHQVRIVPVHMNGDILNVAVTLQPATKNNETGYLVTNVCIKFTLLQFRHLRQSLGNCLIVDEFVSGDQSVVFQLAKYVGYGRLKGHN